MWIKAEKGRRAVQVEIPPNYTLSRLPKLLRDGREITIPEGANNDDFVFLLNDSELPWDTDVATLKTFEDIPVIVRFLNSAGE
jgi:hypothetical protein